MTIQRQYVLPNCSLVLEGLSEDTSNVLSILANAEFKIVGIKQSLAGGLEFFQAVATVVSAYCQRLLSGVDHPAHISSPASLVSVEPLKGQYHRLLVKPVVLGDSSKTSAVDGEPQAIQLSTVQLFDMAEAIDQCCADTQTLPNFSVPVAPLPRRYVRAEEPLTQRAIPPMLGFGTLAVAALGLFFLPVPELVEPEGLEQQDTSALADPLAEPVGSEPDISSTDTPVSDSESSANSTASDEVDIQTVPGPITDSVKLAALQQQVQQQISSASTDNASFEQPLSYQVSVAENGDIVGYNPLDDTSSANVDSTPLPTLTYIPVDSAAVESVAQFDVTFAPGGTVEVTSDQTIIPEAITPEVVVPKSTEEEVLPEEDANGDTSDSDTSGQTSAVPVDDIDTAATSEITNVSTSRGLSTSITTPIQDVDRIYALNQELRRTIINNREPNWSGPAIRYRIRLDEDGNVIGYAADGAAAEQYAADFKIPSLVKATSTEQPQLDFLVVINDNNVIEVSPWDGWP
ncbi:MAG: DUF4335 domain-containing protein [Cyanobacteria bacterium P01_F01_bin.13]